MITARGVVGTGVSTDPHSRRSPPIVDEQPARKGVSAGCRFAFAIYVGSRRLVPFVRFPASSQQVVYCFVCDLLGADEGGIGGDLRLDLSFGQPRRVALPPGVLLAKFSIDRVSKIRPGSSIGPILRAVDPPTDARVDPFDHTTQYGADHDTDADVAFIDAMPAYALAL